MNSPINFLNTGVPKYAIGSRGFGEKSQEPRYEARTCNYNFSRDSRIYRQLAFMIFRRSMMLFISHPICQGDQFLRSPFNSQTALLCCTCATVLLNVFTVYFCDDDIPIIVLKMCPWVDSSFTTLLLPSCQTFCLPNCLEAHSDFPPSYTQWS